MMWGGGLGWGGTSVGFLVAFLYAFEMLSRLVGLVSCH